MRGNVTEDGEPRGDTQHTKGQSPSLRHRNKLNEKAPRGEVGGGRQRRVSTWHAASQLLRPTEQNPPSTPPIVNADQDKLEQRRSLSSPHSHSVRRLGRRTGGDPWEDFFGGTLAWGGGGDHPSLLRLRAAVQISLSTPFQAEVKGVAQK